MCYLLYLTECRDAGSINFPMLELIVKDHEPLSLNAKEQIQVGLRYCGQGINENPNFDVNLTFAEEKTENPVVNISNEVLFFSSKDIQNSVLKNLTVNGILVGYTNIQVMKSLLSGFVTLFWVGGGGYGKK